MNLSNKFCIVCITVLPIDINNKPAADFFYTKCIKPHNLTIHNKHYQNLHSVKKSQSANINLLEPLVIMLLLHLFDVLYLRNTMLTRKILLFFQEELAPHLCKRNTLYTKMNSMTIIFIFTIC